MQNQLSTPSFFSIPKMIFYSYIVPSRSIVEVPIDFQKCCPQFKLTLAAASFARPIWFLVRMWRCCLWLRCKKKRRRLLNMSFEKSSITTTNIKDSVGDGRCYPTCITTQFDKSTLTRTKTINSYSDSEFSSHSCFCSSIYHVLHFALDLNLKVILPKHFIICLRSKVFLWLWH